MTMNLFIEQKASLLKTVKVDIMTNLIKVCLLKDVLDVINKKDQLVVYKEEIR